jgi:hypothetical protein
LHSFIPLEASKTKIKIFAWGLLLPSSWFTGRRETEALDRNNACTVGVVAINVEY